MSIRRLAVLGDIHGNRPALAAVLAQIDALPTPVDRIVCNGDLWSLGPEPEVCLADLLARGDTLFVRGNHDRYMLGDEPGPGVPPAVAENVAWQRQQLSAAAREEIARWPQILEVDLAGLRVEITHAAPGNDELVVMPDQAAQLQARNTDVLILAHIHRPWLRHQGSRVQANCGSVGAPLDEDRRAAWLLLEEKDGQPDVQLRRTEYDVEETIRRLLESPAPMKEALAASLRAARIVAPH